MIGFRTIAGTLFAAALISAACAMEPVEPGFAREVDVSSGGTHTVVCPPGKVMTGIDVFEGTRPSEIRGVEIRCGEPTREPS